MSGSSSHGVVGCHGSAWGGLAIRHRHSALVGPGAMPSGQPHRRGRGGRRWSVRLRVVLQVAEHAADPMVDVGRREQGEQLALDAGEAELIREPAPAGIGVDLGLGADEELRVGAGRLRVGAGGLRAGAGRLRVGAGRCFRSWPDGRFREDRVDRGVHPRRTPHLPAGARLLDAEPRRQPDPAQPCRHAAHGTTAHSAGSASMSLTRSRTAYVPVARAAGGLNRTRAAGAHPLSGIRCPARPPRQRHGPEPQLSATPRHVRHGAAVHAAAARAQQRTAGGVDPRCDRDRDGVRAPPGIGRAAEPQHVAPGVGACRRLGTQPKRHPVGRDRRSRVGQRLLPGADVLLGLGPVGAGS